MLSVHQVVRTYLFLKQQQNQQPYAQATIQNQGAGAPGGPGYNPAEGGQIPQEVAPGATREGVTGEDMMGNEAPQGFGGF